MRVLALARQRIASWEIILCRGLFRNQWQEERDLIAKHLGDACSADDMDRMATDIVLRGRAEVRV